MKRKSGHAMVDLDESLRVVHLNVAAGYLTYLTEEEGDAKVAGVALEGKVRRETG